jgi:hypothetical protein
VGSGNRVGDAEFREVEEACVELLDAGDDLEGDENGARIADEN